MSSARLLLLCPALLVAACASAPETLVDGVIDVLRGLGATRVSVLPGIEEKVEFRLPAELVRVRPKVSSVS